MIIAPMLLAVGAAGRLTVPGLLCVATALAAFCSRSPALALLQIRGHAHQETPARHDVVLTLIYLGLVSAFGLSLILVWERWTLVWFAAGTLLGIGLYTVACWYRLDRAFGWQVVFVVGLTQAGPALYVAEVGRLSAKALALWGLSSAYFSSGLLYVHLRLSELKESRTVVVSRRRLLAVSGLLTAGAAAAGALGLAPPWTALALFPTLGRAMYLRVVPKYSRMTLKAIGREELWMAVAFTALGFVAFFLVPPGW